jgi:hypothetical protein
LLNELPYRFLTTDHVLSELHAGLQLGKSFGAIEGLALAVLRTPIHPSLASELDAGEASVIHAAMEGRADWVCMDELLARFKADALGLGVVGTLGLLGRAKALGCLTIVRPVLDRMLSNGSWFGRQLINQLLDGIGE